MPHLEKIARDMEDKNIQFISLSLDTGEGLIQAWKDFIAKKGDETLNLNLPGGFRSPVVKEYLIKGVPRILIVDKEGRIVDAYAKRPSDPKLKKQLEELL
ncbi:MAG: TlpA family protein disulfide reductase, partial [Bacteroidales bacterium]